MDLCACAHIFRCFSEYFVGFFTFRLVRGTLLITGLQAIKIPNSYSTTGTTCNYMNTFAFMQRKRPKRRTFRYIHTYIRFSFIPHLTNFYKIKHSSKYSFTAFCVFSFFIYFIFFFSHVCVFCIQSKFRVVFCQSSCCVGNAKVDSKRWYNVGRGAKILAGMWKCVPIFTSHLFAFIVVTVVSQQWNSHTKYSAICVKQIQRDTALIGAYSSGAGMSRHNSVCGEEYRDDLL